ncbi:2-phospho-L-lactate guanylyltransferase [Stackebrandtia albiflava]|uniref:2-phospho-L-lactate guanylyltransferase n=1 Tax=Stackebrandtia albiflava TaxID=406432 RepID=UPI0031EBCA92
MTVSGSPGAHRTDWTVLIPVKSLARAKSRLALPPAIRSEVALAFALDTATAAAEAGAVHLVTDDPRVAGAGRDLGLSVIPDGPLPGLNAAIRFAAARFHGPVAVLTGDLPALRGTELAAALHLAARRPAAFVADTAGTGTVLLTGGASLPRPRFGTASAARHREGATELTGDWPGLRRDVDELADLDDAARIGLGRHTTAALAAVGTRSLAGRHEEAGPASA